MSPCLLKIIIRYLIHAGSIPIVSELQRVEGNITILGRSSTTSVDPDRTWYRISPGPGFQVELETKFAAQA